MERVLNHSRVSAVSEPASWIYLLHGIYGSGRNWGSLAKRLVEERPRWGVVLVDLRLHGGSTDMPPPHTLEQCSADLSVLEEHLALPVSALLGHSFGGKVALVHGREPPPGLEQVWIIDSTLRVGEPAGSPWRVLDIVRSLPDRFASRGDFAEAMVSNGYSAQTGHWLAMNLERGDQGFAWKLDWDGLEALLRDYFATDVWAVIEDPPAGVEIQIVKAADSEAVNEADGERIRRAEERTGQVHLHTVAGGHWVNVENPEAILELLVERLP